MLLGSEKTTLVMGNFGSGKTEVSINFAIHLVESGRRRNVSLADLDLASPYFRSREPRKLLESRGVRVVVPDSRFTYADLPILVPEVRSLIMASTSYAVLDVGGDDIGARVLGALHDAISSSSCRALMVLNASRPFTSTLKGIIKMKKELEEAGKIKIAGFISNTHLMEETTIETVLSGYLLAKEAQSASGVPVEFVCALETIAEEIQKRVPEEVLTITRYLAPSWVRSGGCRRKKGGNLKEER